MELTLAEFTPDGLLSWLRGAGIRAEIHAPGVPMPTVSLAAAAIGVAPEQIVKTLLFAGRDGGLVRVIACGPDRIDPARIANLAAIDRPRMARPDVVLDVTGWPAGGVAPVGLRRRVTTLIDTSVLAWETVYGGGGTEETLLQIAPTDIRAITGAAVVDLNGGR